MGKLRFLFLLLLLQSGEPPLVLTPYEWTFGIIGPEAIIRQELTVENRSSQTVHFSILPTCGCLSAEPTEAEIPPAGKKVFSMAFDPREESGPVEKDFIVRTDLKGLEKALFTVVGTVQVPFAVAPGQAPEAGREGKNVTKAAPGATRTLSFPFYYSFGCRSCERLLETEIPRLERELGLVLRPERKNILDPAVYEEYRSFLRATAQEERAFPTLVLGNRVLQGEGEIRSGLKAGLESLIHAGAGSLPEAKADGKGEGSAAEPLALLPVLAAGLLDGINPCAFTTLIFLLAALALAGRGRLEILRIGLFFTASVFATYFLIGLGFFGALRAAAAFPLAAKALKWVLAAVLIAFAGLSLYDYFLIRAGRSREILLQLPSSFKQRIHRTIRAGVRSAALAASSMALGFLVSVFELACTGQVYFPTIAYMLRVQKNVAAIFYLLVYNLGFILPLLGVFALAYTGVSSQAITRAFQRHLGKTKLGLALLFLGLAALTLAT